ncbi:hypothetical protein, partial [Longimicrobium sp.]|uniref:hypothetical protein n=1 Tax=Longimicrobium sp. TaxID=2029185 RepID=UPI003B3B54CA
AWRGAARPLRGPVPAGAEAVWFADTAELIAAFARDAVGGSVARWWWQALLKGLPGGPLASLAALWSREARHVPAALEHLSAGGEGVRIVAALPAASATRILAAVAAAFEVPSLLAAPTATSWLSVDGARGVGSAPSSVASSTSTDARGEVVPSTREEVDRAARSPAPAPWTGYLPREAVPRGLAPEHAALLGVSLMMHRAPLVARSTAFVARFVRWRAEAAAPSSVLPRRSDTPTVAEDAERATRSIERTEASSSSVDGERADRPASAEAHPRETAGVDEDAQPRIGRRASTESHRPKAVDVSGDADRGEDAPVAVAAGRGGEEDAAASEGAEAEAWGVEVLNPPVDEARAASGACGVFFLVNVLRSMGFFRALDEHFGVEPAVGGWAWVELVARALLGPDAAGLADDPLWRVLAELDGREPEVLPGGGFAAPRTEALPERWIDLFGGTPPAPEPSPPLGMQPSGALTRFLDVVIPVIRARIGAALVAAGGDADERLETALLRRMGAVAATRTHVDVHLELDQATLPVRLAGLDANPGWVPELARVVTFYFA